MSVRPLIFGGTFDPPHRAHVQVARAVADALDCNLIVFVPAAVSPHKSGAEPTSAVHRVAMLELAIADEPLAEIDTLELDRGGVSYFIDTIRALRARFGPGVPLRFLIGSDQAIAFPRWRAWRDILAEAEPAVAVRPPADRPAVEAALRNAFGPEAPSWIDRIVDAPLIDVSATEIRRRRAAGEPIDDLVGAKVAEYVVRCGLYEPL